MTFSLILTLGKYGLLWCHHFPCIFLHFQLHEQRNCLKTENIEVLECYRPGLAEIKPHTHIAKVVVKVGESGIAGFKIRNTAQEIRNPLRGIQNSRLSWIPLHGSI